MVDLFWLMLVIGLVAFLFWLNWCWFINEPVKKEEEIERLNKELILLKEKLKEKEKQDY